MKRHRSLPPHLEPARPFLDALVEMVVADVLREVRGQAEVQPADAATKAAAGLPSREG